MIRLHRRLCLAIPVALFGFLPASGFGQEQLPAPESGKSSSYIRVSRDKTGEPVALETAIGRFRAPSGNEGLMVDLVGAVHIGDPGYYDRLNKLFHHYDVVLYELVAPEGTRVPRGGVPATNPLSFLQEMTTDVLDLSHQTAQIDYTVDNFVHADLSPEAMAKAIRDRGDNGLTLLLGVASDFLREFNQAEQRAGEGSAPPAEMDLFTLLDNMDSPTKMKRLFALQFDGMGESIGLGKTLETILIDDRNKAAMKVLQKELAKGTKRIAIFYGAAHMPDFERRLRLDFGLSREKQFWIPAWDLREPGTDSSDGF